MCLGILEDINTAETLFFSEILANDGDKIVKTFLVFQVLHLRGELFKIK